jgi:hypothetical protein
MAFQKKNTPRFVVTGSPRAMKIQALENEFISIGLRIRLQQNDEAPTPTET